MNYQLDFGAFAPERAHRQDAGLDLKTPYGFQIRPGESFVVNTGIHVEIPYGQVGFLKSKSGLNRDWGITSEGVIDSGYTGAIQCKLYNHGDKVKSFEAGDKITQLVIIPVIMDDLVEVEKVRGYERGDSGFGSTGR